MNLKERVVLINKLDSIYEHMRRVQAEHNSNEATSPYRCIGSGNCCRIGLRISLFECYNIAKNIQRKYYIIAESEGIEKASEWYYLLVEELLSRMEDESWQPTGETDKVCAFFNNGCTIYEFRPLVCRAYGTIMPVDKKCPRPRMEGDQIPLIRDSNVEKMIDEFEQVLDVFGKSNPDLNYAVYMPMGVLRFLLDEDQLVELKNNTDEKFWQGVEGYPHRFREENWTE